MITYGSTTLTSYNTITKIEVYYYKSTSATSLSGGSWSTTKPTWENGKYIWQKIRTTYEGKLENGKFYSESDPVNITGQQGQQGVAGTSAYSYKLTASDTIISVSKNGAYSTNSVTFSATSKQGNEDVNPYEGIFKIETTTDGITWTTQYTSSADESSKIFTIPNDISNIRCSLYQAGGTTVLLDITSVSIVRDGIDGALYPNLSPFFSHDLTDIYNAETNPNGYWMEYSSYGWTKNPKFTFTQLEDGWLHVHIDNSSGTSVIRNDCCSPIYNPSVKKGTMYTFLTEFRNNQSTGIDATSNFYLVQQSGGRSVQFWGINTTTAPSVKLEGIGGLSTRVIDIPSDGSYAIARGTKYSEPDDDSSHWTTEDMMANFTFRANAGAVIDYDIRLSMYEGEYWGNYVPYIISDVTDIRNSAEDAHYKIDNLEIGGRNLLLDTATERISPASSNNSAYVAPVPMMSDYGSNILNNRDDYFTYSFDYEVTGNEASEAYIYVQVRGATVPSASKGYYSYVLEKPTGKHCCTFQLTSAQATGDSLYCGIRLRYATNGAVLKVWNLKLERGIKATDWTPAPEDTNSIVQQAIDNIEISGRNLFIDKNSTTGYISTSGVISPQNINVKEYTSEYIPVTENECYILQTWVPELVGTTNQAWLGYMFYSDNSGTTVGNRYAKYGAHGDIYLAYNNIIVPANALYMRVSYRKFNTGLVKLEKGNKSTEWSPAPEDTQADIDTALAQSVEYIVGTQTAATGIWTGATTDNELKIGKTIAYKLPYAGSGNASLVLTLANGSITDAIPIYLNTTRVTTHFGAGSVINMTYDGQYWRASSIPNSNNYDRRQHNNAITAVTAITAKHLIVGDSTGYKQITSTSGGSLEFDLGYPILWAYSAIEATKTSTATYEAYPSVNFSTSGAIQDGAANKMLWLKGTIRGNTFTLASANFLTTRIPTSEDGMYYIPLGIMSSATAGYFSSSNRIYAYVDDAFQPLDNAAALTAIQARSEIVQTQETLSLQIRDISIGGANLFEKTKTFEGITNNNNTHDALTEFVYKDLTVRYANTVTFNNSVVELSAYQFTNLTSDTWYTFSFYAKGNADIGFMYAGSGNAVIDSINVSWNDETYTGFNTTSISSNIIWLTPTDKWQRYNVTFHVEEQDITALHRLIGLYARPVSNNVELIAETKDILRTESGTDVHLIMEGNEILICGYKLELGNKPTDWTPSDKDKAGYDNIISQINLSQEGIAIRADKIRFEGMITANEGFSIDEYGNMTANNGTFNGVFESYATEINENTFDLSINNGHIHFYNNDRTLTEEERHVGYIGGIRNSVSYVSGEEKNNDAIIIRLDNDCDFIIDSQETSGTERVLRVTNHTNDYISVDFWKDLHVYLGKKIQMYGYENNQYPEIIFKRYINDTNQYIIRGTLALHSATGTSDINDRLYLYAKNQGNDLAGDQYLYFAGKGLKYSSSGQPLRTGYVATHKYIATQQFSITDQTITKGSSQNFEIDVTRDGYTPIMCTVTATSGTGAFYLSIYHWTIIGDTVRIFTHNNSTTTDAANITIWVNVLYKLTY